MEKCNGQFYQNIAGYQSICVKNDEIKVVTLDNNIVRTYKRNSKMYSLILKEIDENSTNRTIKQKLASWIGGLCVWCRK